VLQEKGIGENMLENDEKCISLQKTVAMIIEEVSEDICDNYCKYSDTADEDFLCDILRNGGNCPLDRLR
jgi:hypothetical protein